MPGLPTPGMPGGGSSYPGMRGSGGGGVAGQSSAAGLNAGLTILGKGSEKELLEQARDQGLDVLVMFEAEVSENHKTGLVINETRLVFWDVKKGAEFARTSKLNNIAVQRKRDEDKNDDPVENTLDELFKEQLAADSEKGLKLTSFPEAIRPEHVKDRVLAILSVDIKDRLPILAEIKFYQSRGLLDEATLTKSFQKLLGEVDGAKLAQGKKEDRLEVLQGLLPEES